jgi:hypothetical protein
VNIVGKMPKEQMNKQKYNLKNLVSKKNWNYVNSNIIEQNFPTPKVIETKNAIIQKMSKSFSSQEALAYLKSKNLRPANIYELIIFANENSKKFPSNKFTSLIAFGSDYIDSDGRRRVPDVFRRSDGFWDFFLGDFGSDWVSGHCLLCFCDKTLDTLSLKETKYLDSLTLDKAIELVKKEGYKIFKEI